MFSIAQTLAKGYFHLFKKKNKQNNNINAQQPGIIDHRTLDLLDYSMIPKWTCYILDLLSKQKAYR